jgi:hypothetical protein
MKDTNPRRLTKRQIHDMIAVCPVCATSWGKGKCANKECGVVVRIEPKSLNWWMFYPKENGWGLLAPEIEDDYE